MTEETAGTTTELGGWRRLSCYTANLAAFLERQTSTAAAADRMARSARLAVRVEPGGDLAVSQHHDPLHHLDDGRLLRFAGASTPHRALATLTREARRGGVLVLAHSAHLPWSVVPPDRDGPHLVLVEGHTTSGDRWSVTDHFASRMPDGNRQDPWTGTVGSDQLLSLMSSGRPFTPQQERRNGLLFGHPVDVPRARWRWVAPTAGRCARPSADDGWTTHPARVWRILGARIEAQLAAGTEPDVLDDVWAAARHHRHRGRHLATAGLLDPELLDRVDAAWQAMPRTLRLATEAALRGRPRPGLVRTAVERLVRAESELLDLLRPTGWARPRRPEERT